MCGRYFIEETDEVFSGLPGKKGEILPGDAACVYLRENRIEPKVLTWGFQGFDKKLLINARSETADEKPMFKDILYSSRLLVPACWYYEYDKAKSKHALGLSAGHIYMAGLYKNNRFVILTTQASPSVSSIHERMPVILSRDDAFRWLDHTCDPIEIMKTSLPSEVLT